MRVRNRPEWGTGEVLKVAQNLGVYQARVLFKSPEGERVETVPLEWLEKASDLWQRFTSGDFDDSKAYRLKQMAPQSPGAGTIGVGAVGQSPGANPLGATPLDAVPTVAPPTTVPPQN